VRPGGAGHDDTRHRAAGATEPRRTSQPDRLGGARHPGSGRHDRRRGGGRELDELWDECDGGDGDACDLLFLRSPFGSEYEEFGRTCGGREDDDFFGVCGEGLDAGLPSEYGDDPELDVLWDACDGGDLGACDDLWFSSPAGSAYEEFGATCGDRVEEGFADCESRAG
jgi:hypothetical protein